MRLLYSLAGWLLQQPWTAAALHQALRVVSEPFPYRVPKLGDRIFSRFPVQPDFKDLATFLRQDAGLNRAITRGPVIPKQRAAKMEALSNRLAELKIPGLPTEAALAKWIGTDPPHLRWRADVTGRNRRHRAGPLRTYRHRWIPGRGGLPRLLEIPKPKLKAMQRKILIEILNQIPVHPASHGFCPGRSIVTNARVHCGKQTVLRFDLMDFFPSISAARVFRIFRTIGYPPAVARLLMGICTTSLPADVWDARPGARIGADFIQRQRLMTRHLPQGAPTSPALANLAAGRLDRRLASLARAVGADYTRYADDLTFSGGSDLARICRRFEALVAVIADDEGFAVNHRKTRLMRGGVRQHVCGVVVNALPNISRTEFDRLKAILTNCVRHGPADQNRQGVSNFPAYLTGRVAHVRAIHPARGEKLRLLLRRIVWQDS